MFFVRPFSVVFAGCLFLTDVSFSAAAPKARRQAPQSRAPATPIEKTSPEALLYIPDPADEIAALRPWHDSTGKRSISAKLKSHDSSGVGKVVLEKDDGTAVSLPLQKLSKEDQSLLASFASANSLAAIATAVGAFMEADLGDTDARIAENVKTAAQRLRAKSNGRALRLEFPIKNVSETEKNGVYCVRLGPPKFPGSDGWRYIAEVNLKLTKQEALDVGPSSVLLVTGKAQVSASGGEELAPMVALFSFLKDRPSEKKNVRELSPWIIWNTTTITSANKDFIRKASLALVDAKMKLVNGEPKAGPKN